MPTLYTSGAPIPELNVVILGGTTVVIDDPLEIGGLQAICSVTHTPLSGPSGQNPLEGVYRFLNAPFLDLEKWFQMPLQTANFPDWFPNWQGVTSTDTLDDKETLKMILSLASDIWNHQGGKDAGLCLAMSIGDFTSAPNPVLKYEGEHTGLLLLKGSVIATLMQLKYSADQVASPVKFVCEAGCFAVAFFRGRGVIASKIAANLVEDMRGKACEKAKVKLKKLDEFEKGNLDKKKGVIVFLHGLLSTDCATFDTLIEKWKEPQGEELHHIEPNDPEGSRKALKATLDEDYLLVGWPHDTLTGIDNNGFRLLCLLEDIAGTGGPPFAFICHSRGGLVARSAAVKLFAKSDNWKAKLRGCVTFGTPHEGAALVELPPERLIGLFVAIMALKNTVAVPSLIDIFLYQEQCKGFRGIQDLRPAETGGDFLSTLRQKEIDQAPAGKQRLLDVFAIGGHTVQKNPFSRTIERVFGNSQNDFVVETSSSISRYLTRKVLVECDHMSYFSEDQSQKPHFKEVIFDLRKRLQVYDAAKTRYIAAPPQSIIPDVSEALLGNVLPP